VTAVNRCEIIIEFVLTFTNKIPFINCQLECHSLDIFGGKARKLFFHNKALGNLRIFKGLRQDGFLSIQILIAFSILCSLPLTLSFRVDFGTSYGLESRSNPVYLFLWPLLPLSRCPFPVCYVSLDPPVTINSHSVKLGQHLLGEIRHITPIIHDGLLLVNNGDNY
jgi:hypothetical protein